jgi:glycerophosphoryl diester phosphodiesterase
MDGGSHPFRGSGITIPTLEEMLTEFPDQRFNVDLKDNAPAQARDYCELLLKCNAADRVLTASEFTGNLKAVRRILPGMATSASRWEIIGIYFLFRSGFIFAKKKIAADALQIPERFGTSHVATKNFIAQLHGMGVRVHVWTINAEDDMVRILDAGADAIMSDNPALLKRVMKEHAARTGERA